MATLKPQNNGPLYDNTVHVINALMATLKPQNNRPLYDNTVIGTVAVDGWAVTLILIQRIFCLGMLHFGCNLMHFQARPVPNSLHSQPAESSDSIKPASATLGKGCRAF